jgi:hypothetical protein
MASYTTAPSNPFLWSGGRTHDGAQITSLRGLIT